MKYTRNDLDDIVKYFEVQKSLLSSMNLQGLVAINLAIKLIKFEVMELIDETDYIEVKERWDNE